MNEHDSEQISAILEADGMVPANDSLDADVVLLNTCCIRENADNKLYGNLGMLKQQKDANPDMVLAVAGCLAQKDREQIRQRANFVDVVFGTHNLHRAAELINHAKKHGPIVEILEEAVSQDLMEFPNPISQPESKRKEPHRAWVTIQIGCDNSCAFCIVPSVRGPEISRQPEDIISEISTLAKSGVKEVTLLGQNVNSYGRDIALKERKAGNKSIKLRPKFAELLKKVAAVEGISRVRYTSPHPKDILDETITAMATSKEVCEHLHLPLQSGNNRILSEMRRGYTAEKFLARLKKARENISDLAVSTDIIVGFPSETEDDFSSTLEVAAEAEFDSAYPFIFSPRQGTEAAKHTSDFIDSDIIKERFSRLKVVLDHSAYQKHKARIGRTEEVMVEGISQKDATKTTGRTRQNKLVHWRTNGQELSPGTMAMVEITDAAPYFLRGELKKVSEQNDTLGSAQNILSQNSSTPVKLLATTRHP